MRYQIVTQHPGIDQKWSKEIDINDFTAKRRNAIYLVQLFAYQIGDVGVPLTSLHHLYVSALQELSLTVHHNGYCYLRSTISYLNDTIAGCIEGGPIVSFEDGMESLHEDLDYQFMTLCKGLDFSWAGDKWSATRAMDTGHAFSFDLENNENIEAGLSAIAILCSEIVIKRRPKPTTLDAFSPGG